MRNLSLVLSIFIITSVVVEGYRTPISRFQLKVDQRINDDSREKEVKRNIFQELIKAFVEAFPAVLKPPKEMDEDKVNTFDQTSKWVKVSISSFRIIELDKFFIRNCINFIAIQRYWLKKIGQEEKRTHKTRTN